MGLLVLIAAPLAAAFTAALVAGGRPGRLARLELRHLWLLGLATALQAAALLGRPGHGLLTGAVFALVGAWLVVNLRRHAGLVRVGLGIVLLGCGLNGLAIVANGHMPVSGAAFVSGPAGVPDTRHDRYAAITSHTRVPYLGDVLPVAPIHAVVSAGDLALALGVALVLFGVLTTDRRAADRSSTRVGCRM